MLDQLIDIFFNDWHFVARLLVAMLLGGLVGVERQVRGRAAGLRTNILVCMGSAAIIVTFQKLSYEMNMGADSAFRMDPARTAAGVITGIGFLGAGTIVKSQDFVRGLTTAASIWVVSAIGVTVGLGEYIIAIPLTALVLVALYFMHRLPIVGDQFFTLRLKWFGDLTLLAEVEEQLHRDNVHIINRYVSRQPKTGKTQATLELRINSKKDECLQFDRLQTDQRFEEVGLS
ncbi:MgtC/SapB family protein [Pseudodesulfovibrio sp.]|uniref:MgtC/SapB family protein n=1 Tax=unclassified Pseudodesulfovibrio TaxID=2661612 RepID=UPI003AFFED2A